jgi:hypothetical protein
MCKQCVEMVEKYFPDCPEKEYGDFLFSATAFPFGDWQTVERHLKEAKDAGCKTYQDAINYANKQLEEDWAKVPDNIKYGE